MRFCFLLTFAVSSFFLLGCEVYQEIVLHEDLSGILNFRGSAEPFAEKTFGDLALMGGYESAEGFYDSALERAQRDLSLRDGVNTVSLERSEGAGWNGAIAFSDLNSFLGITDETGFFTLSEKEGTASMVFSFDQKRALLLEKLIPVLREPALALFNPAAAAGIPEEVYIEDILGFSFGKDHIPAIRAAKMTLVVSLPGAVERVEGGEIIEERKVRFSLPLVRFLVPNEEIRWVVDWKTEER